MKRQSVVIASVLLLFAVSLSGLSLVPLQAQTNPNAINACVQKNNGQLRIVRSASDCNPSESWLSWSTVGPQGPQGLKGDPGTTGAQGAQGPAGKWARSYAPGVISFVDIKSCTITDELDCVDKKRIGVTLSERMKYVLDVSRTSRVYNSDGEPQDVPSELNLTINRPPISGSSCGSNAVDIGVTQTTQGILDGTFHFCATPDAPIYDVEYDSIVPAGIKDKVNLVTSYVPDSLIFFDVVGANSLRESAPLSEAHILKAYAEWSNGQLVLHAEVTNTGGYAANYLITATDIRMCCEPVEPYTLFLQSEATATPTMTLRPCAAEPLPGTSKLLLTLRAPTGHIYESVEVIWYNPTQPEE